jgi:putative ABC transport system permease protein
MITMYSSIASRRREIGTLRALGFSRRSILLSFLIESLVLAFAGGLLGILGALLLGTVKVSMMNPASWSEIVFSFAPTPAVLLTALLFAGLMGLFGGFFPAVQAARTSPLRAMRE